MSCFHVIDTLKYNLAEMVNLENICVKIAGLIELLIILISIFIMRGILLDDLMRL